ncbi:MAG: pyrroline-5-carboxylate reductase [Candidatus Melainabacteria bacterium]
MGLIGCGNLGSAMLSRWMADGADPKLIKVVDNHEDKVSKLGFKVSKLEELSGVDVLVISVKPWNVQEVLHQIKPDPETIIVSMAAGISLKRLAKMLPEKQPISRVMPNIGVKLGLGVLAIAFNEFSAPAHKACVREILEPLGKTIELKEKDFNAVTALAGSGPAFASVILESFVMGGIAGGLSREVAHEMALKTMHATMELIKSGMSFEEIRFQVSSPAGTTIAGLSVLESDGIRGSIMESIRVASERAAELGSETT